MTFVLAPYEPIADPMAFVSERLVTVGAGLTTVATDLAEHAGALDEVRGWVDELDALLPTLTPAEQAQVAYAAPVGNGLVAGFEANCWRGGLETFQEADIGKIAAEGGQADLLGIKERFGSTDETRSCVDDANGGEGVTDLCRVINKTRFAKEVDAGHHQG